jgi:8-oxo-dGTP pyrophosphatase MutT (NUDIX family)
MASYAAGKTPAPYPFSARDVRARLERMHPVTQDPGALPRRRGDFVLNPDFHRPGPFRDAAVLIPLVEAGGALSIVLTRRSDALANHKGQIALPGGKLDVGEGAVDAALREAEEEIGLDRRLVEPVGLLDPYEAGSGYRIFPVIGFVDPAARMTPNPDEVADIFEVPLTFLMDPVNHERRSRQMSGRERWFYAMPYGERTIWGITAGILRTFYEQVFAEEAS